MKRIIALLLAILMTTALLAACGDSKDADKEDSKSAADVEPTEAAGPEGTYVVKSIDGNDVDEEVKKTAEAAGMTVDEWLGQLGIESASEVMVIELKSDGTAKLDVKMFSTSMDGTWKQDGDKIAITVDDVSGNTTTTNFTLDGNELSNDDGEPKYVFVKK